MIDKIAIIMGSNSDYATLQHTEDYLGKFNIVFETFVVSAHRTPEKMFDFAKEAQKNGFKLIIAGAGGAAHLPGMVASLTNLPVIGVPIKSSQLDGLDSLLSINQMPGGVPVATMAIGKAGAINAALFAARVLGINNKDMKLQLDEFTETQKEMVSKMELIRS